MGLYRVIISRIPIRPEAHFEWALAAFLFGVGVHSVAPSVRMSDAAWMFALPFAAIWIARTWNAPRRRLFAVCMAAFLLGVWRFDVTIPRQSDGLLPWIGERTTVSGRVLWIQSSTYGSQMWLRAEEAGGREVRDPGNVVSVNLKNVFPSAGSTMITDCTVRAMKPTNAMYLARRGAFVDCGAPGSVRIFALPSPWDFSARLNQWREWLTARIGRTLPPDEATLLSGILYGDQDLSTEQRDLMRRAGLMHLVAVSGSNISIVVSVCMAALIAAGLHRRRAFWAASVAIVAFVGFVGASASVVRAAMMGLFVLFARYLGRKASAARLLLIAAAVQCAFDPWALGYDAGFALSFLATWGLIAWVPLFEPRLTWILKQAGLREAFATTASATLMTAPYLAWAFGRVSLAGLFTNLLALPLIPWTMLFGAATAVWGDTSGGWFITLPTYGLLVLIERVAHLADLVPWLDLRTPATDVLGVFAMYAALWCIWNRLESPKSLSTGLQ